MTLHYTLQGKNMIKIEKARRWLSHLYFEQKAHVVREFSNVLGTKSWKDSSSVFHVISLLVQVWN